MTKIELANNLAEKAGITKAFAKELTDILIAELAEGITKDERTYMPGIGIWTKVEKKARQGRNPKNGDIVQIPAKTVIKFRSSIVIE